MTILERFKEGDIRALSKIISFVENHQEGYQELLGQLYARIGKSLRIGITGPPGAGKSTLVNGLARHFLSSSGKVGIIAVDPSSPFTGGALLGDRIRMNEFPPDGRVYFRSMATRGAAGGLASDTDSVAVIYDSFGFDVTLIETVGVGQVELDIIDTCDTVAVVVVPESGDAVQTMKAGLMEIADVFCINKSDRPGAERIAADLKQMLDTRKKAEGGWDIPVVLTEAVNDRNLDLFYKALVSHVEYCRASGRFQEHRREQLRKKILTILRYRFQREFVDTLAPGMEFDQFIDKMQSGKSNPYEVAERLYKRFFRH